ncbi:hypothetical protein GCM10010431_77400 [Streptomyces kunmingensis]
MGPDSVRAPGSASRPVFLGLPVPGSSVPGDAQLRLAGLAPPGPGTVPATLTPSVHRLLERLTGTAPGPGALRRDPTSANFGSYSITWRT